MRKVKLSKRIINAAFALAFMACAVFAAQEAYALRVSMKRIIFEGPVRTEVLSIINNSTKEETYRIGWRNFRMTEDRSLVHVPEGEEVEGVKWANDMIRYAPRRVTVAPGATQQIRLMLRRPRELPEGEYRSHIWLLTEDTAETFAPDEGGAEAGKQSVQVKMQPGLTLPIIVRHGNLSATAGITNAKLTRSADSMNLSFFLTREGNRSLYGDLRFTCIGGGQEVFVRDIRGVAVYTEINKRSLSFKLDNPEQGADSCSRMRIEYIADKEDSQYKGEIMAQAEVSAS